MARLAPVLLLVCLGSAGAAAEPAAYAPAEVLVMLPPGDVRAADAALDAVMRGHGLALERRRHRPGGDVVVLRGAGIDPEALSRALNAGGRVRAASPNYLLQLCVVPNDPMVGLQWHIQDAGDADIDLPEAWDIATGDAGAVIAILDTGVDWTHPDLLGVVWQNLDEIPGNGIDDDGNGWIDDLHGWDVGDGDPDARPDVFMEQGLDVGFHGTHCAGIAVADTDNGKGIAGAGWGCSLMGLKLNDAAGQITVEALTEAVDYAVVNGADVISMSFGGAFSEFAFMQALMDDANAAGVVCVAAAGNGGDNVPVYPAALDGVIAVGATDAANQRASFSTWGDWIDVAAPGAQIWSSVQTNYQWDLLTELLYALSFGYDGVNPYMYSDGTSMACPLVAGVCGLIRSVRPDFTPAQVRERLVATGDALVFDHPVGVKVNAAAALDGLQASDVPAGAPVARIAAVGPNPFNPSTRIAFSLAQPGPVRLAVHDLRGHLVRVLLDAARPAGEQETTWDGRDAAGRAVASGVYAVTLEAGGTRDVRSVTLAK